MLLGDTTFTKDEVKTLLTAEGFIFGTPDYIQEIKRRYTPIEAGDGYVYIENPDWQPKD